MTVGEWLDREKELGEVPKELEERAKNLDRDELRTWIKLAARADSMKGFLEKI